MVLGLPGFEQKVTQYKEYLRNLGRAGIGYTTYAHMANIKMLPYYQTAVGTTRGGQSAIVDLIVAGLDIDHDHLTSVLGFNMSPDVLIVQLLAPPDDLFAAEAWVWHGMISSQPRTAVSL